MQPVIASYTDFSAQSVHKIQPKYEALKTGKIPRKYQSHSNISEAPRPKTADKFSMNEILIQDTNLPEAPPKKTSKPEKITRKQALDNKSDYQKLEWNFKPWSTHRENWLFLRAKPESEFTPKQPPKKIPVSFAAVLVKNALSDGKKDCFRDLEGIGKDGPISLSRVSNASSRKD